MLQATGGGLVVNEQQAGSNTTIGEQVRFVEKNEKKRQERPVQNAEDSPRSQMDLKDQEITNTTIENNVVVVEKYDSDGNLVSKIPPGYVPFGGSA